MRQFFLLLLVSSALALGQQPAQSADAAQSTTAQSQNQAPNTTQKPDQGQDQEKDQRKDQQDSSQTPASGQQEQPAQTNNPPSQPAAPASLSGEPQAVPAPTPAASPTPAPDTSAAVTPQTKAKPPQPKRILGIMPNYRAVSAGVIPPPPTAKQAFKIASQNSFDYSSFFFVGITSLTAEGENAHPQLGKGVAGYGRYYWRGFLDKTDGNYLVIFALPTVFHEDERYYAKGEGNVFKRAVYASSRILITPDYHGHNSFNFSEVLGRGIAQGISATYYPSKDRTIGALAVKYGLAMGRDALTNTFREFWPDIATHVLHRQP